MRVLITGAGSYIGDAVEKRLKAYGFTVDVLDMRDGGWVNADFSGYGSVFHVAGIAHDTGKKKDAALYYAINRDLAVQTAEKAKASGVKQFIFMSSMLVYNGCKDRNITLKTAPKVRGCYGDSKLQADLKLQGLGDGNFRVALVRPPMIFGKGCKGNFPRLVGLAAKAPFFPKIKNRRSMLHIDNLSEFIRLLIESGAGGVYFPQNTDYFCTTDLAAAIAAAKGKRLKTTRLFNWAVRLMFPFCAPLKKLFGDLTYDKSMSAHFDNKYQILSNADSVRESV